MFIGSEQREVIKLECNNIKMLRIKNNLNQIEMAEIGKMSVPSYIKKEKGKVEFTDEQKVIYMEHFDLTLEEFWIIFFAHHVHLK